MQQLIEKLDKGSIESDPFYSIAYLLIKKDAELLLEIEKKQILDAYDEGRQDVMLGDATITPEAYYTQTFKNKDNEKG